MAALEPCADAADADAAYADAADAAAYAAAAADAYADADAADAYADADDAADARLIPSLRWNMRPYYAIYRAWRWQVVMGGKPNPWLPLIEMWKLGTMPIGVVDGEYLIYVPGEVR